MNFSLYEKMSGFAQTYILVRAKVCENEVFKD